MHVDSPVNDFTLFSLSVSRTPSRSTIGSSEKLNTVNSNTATKPDHESRLIGERTTFSYGGETD